MSTQNNSPDNTAPKTQTNVQANHTDDLQIIIISGRSGSGKTSVLNVLADFGYHAIDNMPLSLVPDAVAKLFDVGDTPRIALGVDVRTPRADLTNFASINDDLRRTYGDNVVKILYVTAQEGVLVARFDATRRVHPLMSKTVSGEVVQNLPNAIAKEIDLLEPIASRADIKIDTSQLNIHQLKELIREHLGMVNAVTVNVLSFGFKYGMPIDADYVFDVRILPNPHWEASLRVQTGKDEAVAQFFAKHPEVEAMSDDIYDFMARWLPEFLHNNRHVVTVAIGCTGGKHRSVYIAEQLANRLSEVLPDGMAVSIKHREKRRWLG